MSDSYDKLLKEVTGLREEKEPKTRCRSIKSQGSAETRLKWAFWGQRSKYWPLRTKNKFRDSWSSIKMRPNGWKYCWCAQRYSWKYWIGLSIQKAHRLQQRKDGKPPTILVQFYAKGERDAWLSGGKASKLPGIFFSEKLCSYYRSLLWDNKVKVKTYELPYVW